MAQQSNLPEYEHLSERAAAYREAGQIRMAARFFAMAGESAAAHYDHDAALENLTNALLCTTDTEIGTRFQLLLTREQVNAFRGQTKAWKRDLASLEFLAGVMNSDLARARVAARQAHYQLEMGATDLAISFAGTAVRFAEIAHNQTFAGQARLTWGKALLNQGQLDSAISQISKALLLAQESGDKELEADCIRGIGLHYLERGDLLQARFSYEQAQALYAQIEDKRGQSYILNNLGNILYNQKRFSTAQDYWQRALAAFEVTGDRQGMAMINVNAGAMHMDLGQYDEAVCFTEAALQISAEIKSVMGQAMGTLNLALIKHYQGKQEEAEALSRRAIALGQQMNSKRVEGYALIPLGHALLARDKPQAAQTAYWESLAIWQELQQPNLVMEQRAWLARTYKMMGEHLSAMVQVEPIIAHLEQHPLLEGAESVFHVYLTVVEVLAAERDERLNQILDKGHRLLLQQAADIRDESERDAFLNNVQAHRDLLQIVR